jgi:hypothetical protein
VLSIGRRAASDENWQRCKPYWSNAMSEAEYWQSAYQRACDRCRVLCLVRAALEVRRTVGPEYVGEALRQLNAQDFFTDVAARTVREVFAQEFGRRPDGTLIAPLH